MLSTVLDAAPARYRLVTAERELLDKTPRGCAQVLGEVLAANCGAQPGPVTPASPTTKVRELLDAGG